MFILFRNTNLLQFAIRVALLWLAHFAAQPVIVYILKSRGFRYTTITADNRIVGQSSNLQDPFHNKKNLRKILQHFIAN